MDDFKRKFLLEGLDDIGLTLNHESSITAYEKRRREFATPASS
jgi:3-isopropylmalate/(R)-2-methylmalate dehydratase small subunit